ncbi:hypothetical protein K6119_08150 [Paracrocinitomix mangrovi]|uniref:hypothetical protein n=1 Tax=Paracrocinitomix mangrovi TaxID=2862509 RepID=UPI001C8DB58D|nr:hypothetical protein [Paracrocinitomix mangrovi]UKN03484.1 hypothetical protein K6119_08150 [Paracrocinitomix mangrovi]
MKENLQKFAIYILIGLFGLGLVMLRAGLKNDNGLFSMIGIILMAIVGIIVLIYLASSSSNDRKAQKKWKQELEEFKRNAKKILVDLENVEVKSNSWTDNVVVSVSKYDVLDEIAGYRNSNVIQVDRNLNTVKISIPVEGETIEYLVNIEKDPTTLAMQLAVQKETYLYVSRQNKQEMYLDLEFLK